MCKKIIFILFFCLSLTQAFAIQKIYIFHINGIQNTEAQARKNRDALEQASDLHSNIIANNGHFDLLYNKMPDAVSTLYEQLHDTFMQKRYENLTIDDFVDAYIKDQKWDIKPGSKEYNDLKEVIGYKYYGNPYYMGENYVDLYIQFNMKVTDSSYLLQYLKQGSGGEKPFVLFIAHSQGNLYANSLYKELTEKDGYTKENLSIYGIASPAAQNLGNYISEKYYKDPGYLTSSVDGIINALRLYVSMPPYHFEQIAAANIYIPKGSDTPSHGLITTYLNDPAAHSIIVRNINNIVHYFWMSAIYANLPDSMGSLEYYRKLKPAYSVAVLQDEGSSISIEGLTEKGKCLDSDYYFLAKDNINDNTLGVGYQCVAEDDKLSRKLFSDDFFGGNNRIRVRFRWGGWVYYSKIYSKMEPEVIDHAYQNVCKNKYSFGIFQPEIYRNTGIYVVPPPTADLSCEHYNMEPYGITRDELTKDKEVGSIG